MDQRNSVLDVICRRCRFRFPVEPASVEDWRVEAQCPACDLWSCFTVADTRDQPPDPQKMLEREAAVQRLGEQLLQPINQCRSHPAVSWLDRIGNGVFEDDHSKHCWPCPWWIYRFTRLSKAAYVWEEDGSWFVRGWHPLRGNEKPPDPVEVFTFEASLDRLV